MKKSVIFIIILFAAGILSLKINKPFYGYHDWNAITYGQIAKNYTRYGLIKTKLGQVENLNLTTPDNFHFDTHFPPLFTLLLSIPVYLFGAQPWAIRSLPVIFSLLTVFFIYQLVSSIKDQSTAIVASIITILTPVYIYFGKNPVHETLNLLFIVVNVYLFVRYLKSESDKKNERFNLLLISSFLSLFSGWQTFYLMPALTAIGYVKTKEKKFFIFSLIPFVVLGIHLLHIKLLTGSIGGGSLLKAFLQRLNIKPVSKDEVFTISQFIRRFFLYSRNMFTFPLIVTSALGLIFVPKYRWLLLLLLTGLVHPLVFSNAGYLHDYLQLPVLAFVSVSSSLLLSRLFNKNLVLIGFVLALLSLITKFSPTLAMIHSKPAKAEYDLVIDIKNNPENNIVLPAPQATLLNGVLTRYYLQKPVQFKPGQTDYFIITNRSDKLTVKPYEK